MLTKSKYSLNISIIPWIDINKLSLCSPLSQPVCAVERATAGAWLSQSGMAQSVWAWPSSELRTIYGAVQTQWLAETWGTYRYQSGRTHAEGSSYLPWLKLHSLASSLIKWLISTERYGSVQYNTVRFRMVLKEKSATFSVYMCVKILNYKIHLYFFVCTFWCK